MEKKKVLILIVAVGIGVGIISHLSLSSFLGEGKAKISVQKILLENQVETATIDNVPYRVENVVETGENTYNLDLSYVTPTTENEKNAPARYTTITEGEENAFVSAGAKSTESVEVSEETYQTAKQTSEPVAIFKETKTETKPPLIWPYSISLGIAAGAVIVGMVLSRQELRGSATSMLLEKNMENLSVRDAKIFSQIMKLEEFTIPKLMKEANTSKITTWRTVKKLVENGLVKETDRTKAPSNGLGGRGKPSQVYEFTGKGK